jgi:hypothetical protein
MAEVDTPTVLGYSGKARDTQTNWLAIVAFAAAIIGTPLLRMMVSARPFWDGHALHWVREIVEQIPVFSVPFIAIALGTVAVLYGRAVPNRRRCQALAWAAIALGIASYVLLAGILVLLHFLGGRD